MIYKMEVGPAVLANGRSNHRSARMLRDVLRTVAYAQQREPLLDSLEIDLRGIILTHGIGTSRKDDPFHRSVKLRDMGIRINFAIYIQLPHPPRNQLGILGAEIKDNDFFWHGPKVRIRYEIVDRKNEIGYPSFRFDHSAACLISQSSALNT